MSPEHVPPSSGTLASRKCVALFLLVIASHLRSRQLLHRLEASFVRPNQYRFKLLIQQETHAVYGIHHLVRDLLAGEALADLLYPVKGSKQRVAKLMTAYLPERRLFWARQCAISALALRGDEKTRHSPWKQLALVGRDIASDLPLDQIPLMKQVAEISVRAFERRL